MDNKDYRKEIIEMIERCKSNSAIKYIYTVIKAYLKSRGI